MANQQFEFKYGSINEKIIAVASGKGGVGKSTITVNLALALSKTGKEVGIIDADVRGFSIPRILGLSAAPEIIEEKDELIPPEVNGVKAVSMGSLMPEDKALIWRAPLLTNTFKQFIEDVHWGELDYLVIDLPPGTGDMPLNVMQLLAQKPELVVITTPQIAATKVAGRIGKMAQKLNTQVRGVIENMSYYRCPDCKSKHYIFGQGGGKELAGELKTDLLAEIPLVTKVRESSDRGRPVLIEEPNSKISNKFIDIAEQITGTK